MQILITCSLFRQEKLGYQENNKFQIFAWNKKIQKIARDCLRQ